MVLISHKYKFIYIKNKKVAGTSVESFFGKYCQDPDKNYEYTDKTDELIDAFGIIGARSGGKKNGKNINGAWGGHKSAALIKKDLGNDLFDNYLKFCVIRNPYDKIVSKYFWKESPETFKDFARHVNVNNMFIHSIDGKSVCDYYIRYETLEEDIIKLCKKLGIEDYDIKNLPKHKTKQRKNKGHYSKFYDEETRKLVYKNHRKEFELFGYKFNKN
tara:strand:+ start:151 stop:798 length:648 start_codon:yes stop_codon:yes gene_type:complete